MRCRGDKKTKKNREVRAGAGPDGTEQQREFNMNK